MNNNVSEDLIKEIKNKYFRDYRKKNPHKSKEAQKRYWQRKAEQELKNNT